MKVKIFDVCWTMYKSNTTFDFVKFIYKVENIKSFHLSLLCSKIGKILILLIGKLIGRDLYREQFVSLLKGFSRKDLEHFSEKFYKNYLLKNKIDYTFDILSEVKTNNVVLCSASLDIVVSYIAKELKVEFYASELEFKDGVCVGKISKDLLGCKEKTLEGRTIELVVTDNISDLGLAKKSSEAVILAVPKNISFWNKNGFDVNYILNG